MATKEQLRRLRMKYHLGEFRTSTSRKNSGTKRRSRRSNGERMARRFRRSRGSRNGGMTPYLVGAFIGALGTPIVQRVPILNSLPPVVATPVAAAGVGKFVLKQNPMKCAIGAVAGSFLLGGMSTTSSLNNDNW